MPATRAMWKGSISFGLVTIPVRVTPATEEHGVHFNQLHDADMGRIRYKRVCSLDGEEVAMDHIVRGYEIEKDRYVVVTDEDLEGLPVESHRAIDIHRFVDIDEIDPMLFKRPYFLVPDETGVRAYALLRNALADERRVGIAKVAFREKEHLAAIRCSGDAIVLETMYWPDELRTAEIPESKGAPRRQEVEMAKTLIDQMTGPWEPSDFHDEYRDALLEVVERKAAGQTVDVEPAGEPAPVIDLMAALKASVEAGERPRRRRKRKAA